MTSEGKTSEEDYNQFREAALELLNKATIDELDVPFLLRAKQALSHDKEVCEAIEKKLSEWDPFS